MSQKERGRRDHILPKAYLDGFCGADGTLQVFDIKLRRWFQQIPENVAWQDGYYDYSEGATPDQTADQAFNEYERKFSPLVRDLTAANFSGWTNHQDFLIRYVNMIRVRTPLFRQQFLEALDRIPPMQIEEVLERHPHPDQPGMEKIKARVGPIPHAGDDRVTAYRDMSISKMRADLQAVPKEFFSFDWCLRHTADPQRPLVTADDAIRLEGPDYSRYNPLTHKDTMIVFPLCRQACLVGRAHRQIPKTRRIGAQMLRELQGKYLSSLCRFAYSPVRLGCQN